MKKEDVTAVIIYLILIVAAVIFGITVLQSYSAKSGLSTGAFIGFVAGAIVTGIILNALILELGHLLGAKVGGYIVTLINVLGFCWIRNEEGKYKFKFKSFSGLSGETKIIPNPNAKKEPSPRAYLLFGVLFFLIEVLLVVILFSIMNYITTSLGTNAPAFYLNIGYFFVTAVFVGALMFVYDILPFRLDPPNDGYQFVLTANKKNVKAFNELLRVEHEIEMGNNDVDVKIFDEITNFTADLNLNKVYTLLAKDELKEAEKILNQIVDAKANVSEKVYVRSLSQIIYIKLVTESVDAAKKYLEEKVTGPEKTLITTDNSMVCLRVTILIEGLFDNSKSECLIALQNLQKAYKNTPKKRQEIEVKLFNEAIKRVSEAHPKWEFDQYLIKQDKEEKKEEK